MDSSGGTVGLARGEVAADRAGHDGRPSATRKNKPVALCGFPKGGFFLARQNGPLLRCVFGILLIRAGTPTGSKY